MSGAFLIAFAKLVGPVAFKHLLSIWAFGGACFYWSRTYGRERMFWATLALVSGFLIWFDWTPDTILAAWCHAAGDACSLR